LARRNSFHKQEKRRKELKRLKKQEAKREKKLGKDREPDSWGPPVAELEPTEPIETPEKTESEEASD